MERPRLKAWSGTVQDVLSIEEAVQYLRIVVAVRESRPSPEDNEIKFISGYEAVRRCKCK